MHQHSTEFTIHTAECEWLREYITPVADFPKKGIVFQWYANLLQAPNAFHKTIQTFAERYRSYHLDKIAGLDSRGFIFGAALAYELKLPFIMIRKFGKLPRKVEKIDYQLEYGTNCFEIECETITPNDRILIVDDVFATGGTTKAASELVERLAGNVIEIACLIEIASLQGRNQVNKSVYSLIAV